MWNGLRQADTNVKPVGTQLRDKGDVRIIPYDYVASFPLTGQVGNLIEDVINISVEGIFVAVAVGYGLEADTASKIELISTPDLTINDTTTLDKVTLANVSPHVLMDGFRFNPALERLASRDGRLDETLNVQLANQKGLFQSIRQAKDFNFLFNIIDTGAGRELQNLPIHSIAGLGKSNGERPFRMLAKPLTFLPRSSVRIQVEERSANVSGRLFIVLHGYKILGAAGVALEHIRTLHHKAMRQFGMRAASAGTIRQVEQKKLPSERLVPFDYVGTSDLTGVKGNVVEEEIPVNVEGGYVATSIGYSLSVDDSKVEINLDEKKVTVSDGGNLDEDGNVVLSSIRLTQFPSTVLKEGFRIRPEFLRLAFANGKLTTLPVSTVQNLFERLNLPDNVSFLYSILDTGTGRDWQNEPVHNIAGLGIANGDRPFRNLAWPMHFLPRSTIRLKVEEIFGWGRLFMVFQGYKILGIK